MREIREAGDNGKPLVAAYPEHPQSLAFRAIAQQVVDAVAARPAQALPTIH